MLGRSSLAAAMAIVMTTGFAAIRPNGELIESTGWHTPTLIGGVGPSTSKRGYRGPGTTAAQIKRASKKARNVRRHKRH